MRLSIAVAVVLLLQGCVNPGNLDGIRMIVVNGEPILLDDDGIRLTRRGDTLDVEVAEMPGPAAGHCQIELSGFSEVRINSIVAERVSIFMDGTSRLDVESLTSSKTVIEAAGFSRASLAETL